MDKKPISPLRPSFRPPERASPAPSFVRELFSFVLGFDSPDQLVTGLSPSTLPCATRLSVCSLLLLYSYPRSLLASLPSLSYSSLSLSSLPVPSLPSFHPVPRKVTVFAVHRSLSLSRALMADVMEETDDAHDSAEASDYDQSTAEHATPDVGAARAALDAVVKEKDHVHVENNLLSDHLMVPSLICHFDCPQYLLSSYVLTFYVGSIVPSRGPSMPPHSYDSLRYRIAKPTSHPFYCKTASRYSPRHAHPPLESRVAVQHE